jgi:hypothetical protein
MKSKEKLIIAIIAGWTTLHLMLLLIVGDNNCVRQNNHLFWPFDDGILECLYDIKEFLTYVLPAIIIYIVYKLLNLINIK